MTGPGRRFDPSELSGDGAGSTDAEYAELLAAARELEALAGVAAEPAAPAEPDGAEPAGLDRTLDD